MAIANGDEARAKIFAERAYAARVVIGGDDNPETAKLRTLAERPSQHPLYQNNKDFPPDITPPQEIDEPKFDDWLWRRNEWSEQPAASIANDPWDIFSNDPPHIYGQFLDDGESESFDSLSTSSIQAALFRSLSKSRFN
ncbi:SET domain-containing protein [Fusarium pseudocircinatum]|uniref:SET domain-containing protein n=1 Tax=Fusarium pseudocircinatum TaxID=56676 RepID=A0A8H5NRZ5_9HYPO|nr:SET domain-containing protein [Fusarium pseudocircinatum]